MDDNIDAAQAPPDEVAIQDRTDMARKERLKKIEAFNFALPPSQGPDETFSKMPGASSNKDTHSGEIPFLPTNESMPSCSILLGGSRDTCHEARELLLVQRSCGANAGAKIDSERPDCTNRLADVCGVQPAGEKDRDRRLVHDLDAEEPVVRTAGATKYLDRKRRIPGIEEKSVDLPGNLESLCHRLLAGNVDNLYERDTWQRPAQLQVGAPWKVVADLHRVHSTPSLLGDDLHGIGPASEKERGDRRRHRGRNLRDESFGDDAWPATRHLGYQAKRRCPEADGQASLLD